MEVDVVTLASEFPNDNPALHRGVIWGCRELTGPATPERWVNADDLGAALEGEGEPAIVVEELEPFEAHLEGAVPFEEPPPLVVVPRVSEVMLIGSRSIDDESPSASCSPQVFDELATDELGTDLPTPAEDPFALLISKLVDVAVAAGSFDIAAVLPELLEEGRVSTRVGLASAETLRAAGLLDGNEVVPTFVAIARAWRDILRGTSDDFDACGGGTLDEWASELLAKLLGAPAKSPLLRQELRRRGVAAFGLAA